MPPKKKVKSVTVDDILKEIESSEFEVDDYELLLKACKEKISKCESNSVAQSLKQAALKAIPRLRSVRKTLEEEEVDEGDEEYQADQIKSIDIALDVLENGTFSDGIAKIKALKSDPHEGVLLYELNHGFGWTYKDEQLTFSHDMEYSNYGMGSGLRKATIVDDNGDELGLEEAMEKWGIETNVGHENMQKIISSLFETISVAHGYMGRLDFFDDL